MSDLLPCPFCGAHAKHFLANSGVPGMEDCGYYLVECPNGHAHVSSNESDDEAFAAWNTRALASPPAAAVQPVGGLLAEAVEIGTTCNLAAGAFLDSGQIATADALSKAALTITKLAKALANTPAQQAQGEAACMICGNHEPSAMHSYASTYLEAQGMYHRYAPSAPPQQAQVAGDAEAGKTLLPCPLCGGEARGFDLAGWEVMCECGLSLCLETTDRESITAAWNTRYAYAAPKPAAVVLSDAQCDAICEAVVAMVFNNQHDRREPPDTRYRAAIRAAITGAPK